MKTQSNLEMTQALTPGLRRFLYLTAGCTGAAILIVEILGAKMLSPYVGTSHFVWTAQIAVTLLALAAGYAFGGWLVDRSPRLRRLYFAILAAAIYLALTLLVVEPVAYWSLRYNLAVGALLTSTLLFFVPLTLLAAAGPFLVRVLTQSVAAVGGQVGRLSAISTFGSVVGTVLIGYCLIPFLPNSMTMYLTACALFALVLVYFLIWGRGTQGRRVTLLFAAAAVAGFAGVQKSRIRYSQNVAELHRGNSNFGLLQVIDTKDGRMRFYLNDYLTQNTYSPRSKHSLSMFTYMLHQLAHAYADPLRDVLCIGLGVGIVPMAFATEGVRVDVAEINPAVIPVAEEFFGLEPERLNIAITDGRYLVNKTQKQYDAIILDAFLGDSSPSHLMTQEAFSEMKRILRPAGVLVINSFGDFSHRKAFFTGSLDKTLKTVFPHVLIHTSGNGNVFFVAGASPLNLRREPDYDAFPTEVRHEIRQAFNGIVLAQIDEGQVLTDNFNPVDFYDAVNRERHRRSLAFSMRGL